MSVILVSMLIGGAAGMIYAAIQLIEIGRQR
jgi:hypothetical protein